MVPNKGYTVRYRILKYLRESGLKEFTSADLTKALNFTTRGIGSYLRDVPGVRIKARRKNARLKSGVLWVFEDPGWQ